jgi:hypothetical protein
MNNKSVQPNDRNKSTSTLYSYYILREPNLVIQYLQGIVTLDVLKEIKLRIWADVNYNPEYPLLVDIQKGELYLTENELQDYGSWINCNQASSKKPVKSAILTDTPNQVATATLFILKNDIISLNYEVFSTIDGAAYYLEIDNSELKEIYRRHNIFYR